MGTLARGLSIAAEVHYAAAPFLKGLGQFAP